MRWLSTVYDTKIGEGLWGVNGSLAIRFYAMTLPYYVKIALSQIPECVSLDGVIIEEESLLIEWLKTNDR